MDAQCTNTSRVIFWCLMGPGKRQCSIDIRKSIYKTCSGIMGSCQELSDGDCFIQHLNKVERNGAVSKNKRFQDQMSQGLTGFPFLHAISEGTNRLNHRFMCSGGLGFAVCVQKLCTSFSDTVIYECDVLRIWIIACRNLQSSKCVAFFVKIVLEIFMLVIE